MNFQHVRRRWGHLQSKRFRSLALLFVLAVVAANSSRRPGRRGEFTTSTLASSASASATVSSNKLEAQRPLPRWLQVPGWLHDPDRARDVLEMEAGVEETVMELIGEKKPRPQAVLADAKAMEAKAENPTLSMTRVTAKPGEPNEAVVDTVEGALPQLTEEQNDLVERLHQLLRYIPRPKDMTWKATITIPVKPVRAKVVPNQIQSREQEAKDVVEEGEGAYAVIGGDTETVSIEPIPEKPVSHFFHFRRAKKDHVETEEEVSGPIDYAKSPYAFTLFQEGDGSKTDPDGLPLRYINMQRGNREVAKKCLEKTIQWREEHDINTILARPHPLYDKCKTVFPHYFCGRDDTGHVILLQQPGGIDLERGEKNNLSGEDLLFHYVYVMEYLWQILEPRPNETMTSIIDLEGVTFSILGKSELIGIVKLFCSVMDSHFPQRSYKTFMINAPRWFNALYKFISPLLRENTKKKIFIFSKGEEQDEALRSIMTDRELAPGADPMTLLQPAEMEDDLREFVLARLKESGESMEEVV